MTIKKAVKKEEAPELNISFEKAMERLGKIVEEMEGGELSLDSMISRFEEGQGLIRFCSKKLNEVEKKVEMLVKKGGQVTEEPFEPEQEEKGKELF